MIYLYSIFLLTITVLLTFLIKLYSENRDLQEEILDLNSRVADHINRHSSSQKVLSKVAHDNLRNVRKKDELQKELDSLRIKNYQDFYSEKVYYDQHSDEIITSERIIEIGQL